MPPDEYDIVTALRPGQPAGAEAVEFELRVVAGPDAGKVFVVRPDDPSPALAGKGPACPVLLTDPEASRRHASLEVTGATLRLVDLGSTNGTFVDGLRVYDAALDGGETLQLGSTLIHVASRRGAQAQAQAQGPSASSFGPVLGASSAMRRLHPLLERAAASRVPVVIEGETGTGKELVAEALHRMGPWRDRPFAVFDGASVAPGFVEETLFGREATPGSPGATGIFEQAAGGTLVLDEVGELSLEVQSMLVRALGRGEIRRVGSTLPTRVDVRVVAITRRDLDAMVQAGTFRDDLFYRLAVARIELPPLRKRLDDVPLLVGHFWRALRGPGEPPPELVDRLRATPWPGNVRELENAVARAIALGEAVGAPPGAAPREEDVFETILASRLPLPLAREKLVDAFERAYVARVLSDHDGNVARAASASGLALRYFQVLKARQARVPPP
ncbi:MAG TPA: sigma 54-interacting transcriptional regulator [Polyangiaceae bacterium]|jgi:DNA-binding NtrC family response regulator